MPRPRRISRSLIAALALLIAISTVLYAHHVRAQRRALALNSTTHTNNPNLVEVRLAGDERHGDPAPAPADHSTINVPAGKAPAGIAPAGAVVTQTPNIPPAAKDLSRGSSASAGSPPTTTPVSLSATNIVGGGGSTDTSGAAVLPKLPVLTSSTALADARAKKDSGDLLAARDILNSALASGRLAPSDAEAARALCGEINQTLIFSPRRVADDPFVLAYAVQSGERLSNIASKHSLTWELLSRINGIEPRRLRSGTTIKVIKGPFYAVVNKSAFRLDVYLGSPDSAGNMFVESFPVGLGKDNSTPSGTWMVQAGNKIRHPKYYSPRGEGVLDADDPKNPLAGYWLGLAGLDGQAVGKTSYGVHGTIDPSSIGKMESMGCIRLRSDDIALLFDLLVEGKSKVIVKD